MRLVLACLGAVFLAGASLGYAKQEKSQEKPKDNPPPSADTAKTAGAEKKNPVAPTPEGLAGAKKIYGYDCAMCHGASGDGKGDLAGSMSLTLKDWLHPGALSGDSIGELTELCTHGNG